MGSTYITVPSRLTPHSIMIDKFRAALTSKLPPGSFIRNVVTLMTGTTFAQALMILVAPILTRLYSPEDFGVYALYISILGIIAVVACWCYEFAIVLPENDEDAANILVISLLVCLAMVLLTLILVALFRKSVANILGAPELASWLWFMPLSLIVAGLFQVFNYWSTRRKHFRRLAIRQITQSTITVATQLGIGFILYPGPGGLIGGSIVGQFTATGRLAWHIWRDEGKQLLSYIKRKDLYRMLARYKKFPLYSSWSALLNTASAMLPVLLLGYFFTPKIVGYYALGHRVLATPMGVIGGSVAQAFFPRAAEARRSGNLDKITFELFQQLLTIGLIPILLIAIVAPELFSIIFGHRWVEAGVYAQWLCLWIIFQFISSPISTIITVLEKQRLGLMYNISLFSGRIIALIIGGILQNPLLAIKLLGLVGAIMYFIYGVLLLNLAKVKRAKVVRAVITIVLKSVPFILVPTMGIYMKFSSITNITLSFTAGLLFVACYIRKTKKVTIS
jgi:lipopolysaccharide exporter